MIVFRRPLYGLVYRLLTCGMFAAGLFVYKWDGAVLLFGFWIEEVIAFIFIGIKRRVIGRRAMHAGSSAKTAGRAAGASPLVYALFPAVHLIFVIVFIFIDASSHESSSRLLKTLLGIITFDGYLIDRTVALGIGVLAGSFIAAGLLETAKDVRFGADGRRATLASLDMQNRAVLVLPHITIIFGGFAMIVLDAGNWIALGLLGGKCVCELLLVPRMRDEEEKLEEIAPDHDI